MLPGGRGRRDVREFLEFSRNFKKKGWYLIIVRSQNIIIFFFLFLIAVISTHLV